MALEMARVTAALVAATLVARAAAAETTVDADVLYGEGDHGTDEATLFIARLAVSHEVRRLRIGVALAFARSATTDEGETTTDTSFSSPLVSLHYRILERAGFVLGAGVGFIPSGAAGDDPARGIAGAFDSARRPYEMSPQSALSLGIDGRYRIASVTIDGAIAAYLANEQLEAGHARLGVTVDGETVWWAAHAYALVVDSRAETPRVLPSEAADRAYYGVAVRVGAFVGPRQRVGVGVWKPFGYDRSDVAESMLAFVIETGLVF